MGLAQSLEKVAGTVISKFGGDVTIRYVTAGVYNTTTGASTETTSDSVVKGVLEGVSKGEVNGLIQAEDKRLIVAATDLPSAPGTKDSTQIDRRLSDCFLCCSSTCLVYLYQRRVFC